MDFNMTTSLSPGFTTTDQPCSRNDTSADTEFQYVIIVPILVVMLGLIGNGLVFLTSAWSKKVKMHQHAFILSLAVADSMFLIFVMPLTIKAMLDGGWTSGDFACHLQGYILGLTCHASLCSIATIAINRYVSVVHIASYKLLFTTRNIVIIIASVWVYCLLLPFPALVGWGRISFSEPTEACLYDWNASRPYTYFVLTFGFVLPATIIIYCYIRIWVTFRTSRKKVLRRSNTIKPLTGSSDRNRNEDLRLAGQLLTLFLVFFICWAPYIIYSALIDPEGKGDRLIYDITANMLIINSIMDPALYFFFNATLRAEAIKLFRRLFCLKQKEEWQQNNQPTGSSSKY